MRFPEWEADRRPIDHWPGDSPTFEYLSSIGFAHLVHFKQSYHIDNT